MVHPGEGQGISGRAAGAVADLLALKGDAVDNISRARRESGTRARRISSSDSVGREAALETPQSGAQGLPRGLQNHAEQVRQSKRLATISTDVPVPFSWNR